MGNSWDELTYIINCLDARKQKSCYQNHIPTVMCNICSSSFHISDACPILLDTAFCGETQFVGNFQGHYYQEQNSYPEQSIWSHPQFQQIDSLVVEPQLSLEEMIKQMDENHKQRDEQIQSSLQSLAVQVEQIVSNAHQIHKLFLMPERLRKIFVHDLDHFLFQLGFRDQLVALLLIGRAVHWHLHRLRD
jgi:hypothetical protein